VLTVLLLVPVVVLGGGPALVFAGRHGDGGGHRRRSTAANQMLREAETLTRLCGAVGTRELRVFFTFFFFVFSA
jgi:hypothetical protein